MNLDTISLPKALVGKANKEEEKTLSLSTSVEFSKGRIADLIQIPVWWLIYICLDSQPTPKPTNQPTSLCCCCCSSSGKEEEEEPTTTTTGASCQLHHCQPASQPAQSLVCSFNSFSNLTTKAFSCDEGKHLQLLSANNFGRLQTFPPTTSCMPSLLLIYFTHFCGVYPHTSLYHALLLLHHHGLLLYLQKICVRQGSELWCSDTLCHLSPSSKPVGSDWSGSA